MSFYQTSPFIDKTAPVTPAQLVTGDENERKACMKNAMQAKKLSN